jgi:antitoxin component of MazEF toxin-antitoxin module
MSELRRVIKVGNSLAITIPASFVRASGIRVGKVTLLELGCDASITLRTIEEKGLKDAFKLTGINHEPATRLVS